MESSIAGPTANASNIDVGEVSSRHKIYYLQDGLVFLVENVLFKVPRFKLELDSPFFHTLFSLPNGSKPAEGSTDADPIIIAQVMSVDFERLLALLYPLTLEYSSFTEKWSTSEWLSILRLATMWDMTQARSLAIQSLSKVLTPLEKVMFGRGYDYSTWVLEGFTILCLLPEYLTVEEACQLATEDLIKYGVVRETIRCRLMKPIDRSWSGTWTGATYARMDGYEDGMTYRKDPLVKELIETHFLGRPVETRVHACSDCLLGLTDRSSRYEIVGTESGGCVH